MRAQFFENPDPYTFIREEDIAHTHYGDPFLFHYSLSHRSRDVFQNVVKSQRDSINVKWAIIQGFYHSNPIGSGFFQIAFCQMLQPIAQNGHQVKEKPMGGGGVEPLKSFYHSLVDLQELR